jgi:3-oxoadipate enol-lactonase
MQFIEVNGVSLRYALEGSGKPLVLIHEMGGSIESWDLMAPVLSAKRRVLRYDMRGAGFSEKIRGGVTIDTMTDDLIALLDALGITEKVGLAGMAVGGAVALHTAARFPDRVAGAVVTSPAISIPAANREAVTARVAKLEREGMRSAVDATAESSYPPAMRQDAAKFAAWRAGWLANDPASYGAVYRMLIAMDLGPELATIKCPVVAIGGEHDLGRPPSRVEPIAKAIPGAQFKVLPCGHYSALHAPELLAAEIEGLLDKAGA